MRAAGAKRHDLLKSQLDSGKLDPRALISQSEQNRGQFDADEAGPRSVAGSLGQPE